MPQKPSLLSNRVTISEIRFFIEKWIKVYDEDLYPMERIISKSEVTLYPKEDQLCNFEQSRE